MIWQFATTCVEMTNRLTVLLFYINTGMTLTMPVCQLFDVEQYNAETLLALLACIIYKKICNQAIVTT